MKRISLYASTLLAAAGAATLALAGAGVASATPTPPVATIHFVSADHHLALAAGGRGKLVAEPQSTRNPAEDFLVVTATGARGWLGGSFTGQYLYLESAPRGVASGDVITFGSTGLWTGPTSISPCAFLTATSGWDQNQVFTVGSAPTLPNAEGYVLTVGSRDGSPVTFQAATGAASQTFMQVAQSAP